MTSIGIIGFGRFGGVLGKILSDDFKVKAYDEKVQDEQFGVEITGIDTVLKEKSIFVAVPIRAFKEVILDISPRLSGRTTILDVCSVKVYPATVMKEALPDHIGIITTHPLFGPDSITRPKGLTMMMHPTRDNYDMFPFWKEYFESKAIKVVEMTPEEHDRLAARTQGVTHFVGRVLKEAGVEPTEIDTLGFRDLLHVIDQTCHDSWELFTDLQNFNPYTLPIIETLESAIETIRGKIIRRD
ncbi:MAG: prephenate dehydrogenase/arogenate dehydrogenase family protein [Candidatus Neomarinimicrobiota bacterium]